MTTPKEDGGSAFPMPGHDCPLRGDVPCEYGISQRDYIAIKAMAAIIKPPERNTEIKEHIADICRVSYWYADAMLKARGE